MTEKEIEFIDNYVQIHELCKKERIHNCDRLFKYVTKRLHSYIDIEKETDERNEQDLKKITKWRKLLKWIINNKKVCQEICIHSA